MPFRTAQEATQLLIAAGIAQAAIAKRANVSQPTVSRILSGEHRDPKGSVLMALNKYADEVQQPPTESQSQ
jgi:transcriptional regulator with XRE-family HTH domain